MHLILATLVQRVTFDLVPGQTIESEPLITLRPKNGFRVVVRRREVGRGEDATALFFLQEAVPVVF